MNFSDLLNTKLIDVSSHSKKIKPGGVYVAIKGVSSDGHQFIDEAIFNGAKYIVYENEISKKNSAVNWIHVSNSRVALSQLAAAFFQYPSHDMKIIGVTGTSGKTTSTFIIESILKEAGYRVGVIGTVEVRYLDKKTEADQTTPGPIELHRILREMKDAGCTAVVMEVSSHALTQARVDHVEFDSALFTNLSSEHLDYHRSLEEYFQAKSMLFKLKSSKKLSAAIGIDTDWGQRLFYDLKNNVEIEKASFSLKDPATLHYEKLIQSTDGFQGVVKTPKEKFQIKSSLLGEFNSLNILGAIAAINFLNISPDVIVRGVANCKRVVGRMDWLKNKKGIQVLIDYAHKPDALEKVLESIRSTPGVKKITTVFGCGGDRDRTKRPKMGAIAERLSDHIFVTSDNPRSENAEKIIEEILSGITDKTKVTVEPDRAKAIEKALTQALPEEVVLIAGKGHETYQILPKPDAPGQTYKIHFDDREIAENVISRLDS